MNKGKTAFVLMPFCDPYNSYYSSIFKPALEELEYSVRRVDDLYAPRPIMLDIQESILDADLILCEMSKGNPNVFYELGLCHAIGKPAILISHSLEDIPFDLKHVRVLLYDCSKPGWEYKLHEAIKSAAVAVEASEKVWPPSLIDYTRARETPGLERYSEKVKRFMTTEQRQQKLRPKFEEAHQRGGKKYTNEENEEIEKLYQFANKNGGSSEAIANLHKIIECYPKSNRAGCAMLYLGQRTKGEEAEGYLRRAIEEYYDCFYGDGVQVGVFAKFQLARILLESDRRNEAEKLLSEILEFHPEAVDHQGNLLSDIISLGG